MSATLSCVLFYFLFYFFNHIHGSRFGDDFGAHFLIAIGESRNYLPPPHWVFFQTVNAIYLLFGDRVSAYNGFLAIISLCAVFKYFFATNYFYSSSTVRSGITDVLWVHALGLGLLFCTVIPLTTGITEVLYLGYITPICWRRPTTIVSTAIAILLFFSTAKFLRNSVQGKTLILSILMLEALLVHTKPNYMLAFIPGLCLYVMAAFFSVRVRIDRKRIYYTLLLIFVGTLLLLERNLTFSSEQEFGLQLSPFTVWLNFNSNDYRLLFIAFLTSVALPIISIVEHRLKGRALSGEFIFGIAILGIAILQYILFAEIGFRMFHRNMLWQSMTASTIIHLVILKRAFEHKDKITLLYFAVEVAMGIWWFYQLTGD